MSHVNHNGEFICTSETHHATWARCKSCSQFYCDQCCEEECPFCEQPL